MPWTERHFPEQEAETDALTDGFDDYAELCMINDILRTTEREETADIIDTVTML